MMHERNRLGISPSLLAARSDRYGEAAAQVEQAGVDSLHIDVMDGHYVPNLSFGPNIVAGIRAACRLFLDVHLMVEHPSAFLDSFITAGADGIIFHPETDNPDLMLRRCKERNIQSGIALKPSVSICAYEHILDRCDLLLLMGVEPGFGGQVFMPSTIGRIQEAVHVRKRLNSRFRIGVDGGINGLTAASCRDAGADMIVAGSAIFGAQDIKRAIESLKGEMSE